MSIIDNIKQGASDAVDAITDKIDDLTVTGDVAKARIDICDGCTSFNESLHVCKECGCFMPVKVKLKHVACPLNKW